MIYRIMCKKSITIIAIISINKTKKNYHKSIIKTYSNSKTYFGIFFKIIISKIELMKKNVKQQSLFANKKISVYAFFMCFDDDLAGHKLYERFDWHPGKKDMFFDKIKKNKMRKKSK